MLHIYDATRRTIAFKSIDGNHVWIHEQETFPGPNEYEDVDGISNEEITLTYGTEDTSGHPINQLSINYRGEDPRLDGANDPTLEEVIPILAEWGYK